MADRCSSSSDTSTRSEEEPPCPNKIMKPQPSESMMTSDPALFDISPQIATHNICDNYKAAMCCRIGKAQPPALSRLHNIMEEVVGPTTYTQFVGCTGSDKPMGDTMVARRIMDMLDMKNKILLAANELPKAFEKIASSHAASRYQGAMEAAEQEMIGIFDDAKAEEAAVQGVEKFQTGVRMADVRPQPTVTVLGYIGCYDDCEKKQKQKPKQKCPSKS